MLHYFLLFEVRKDGAAGIFGTMDFVNKEINFWSVVLTKFRSEIDPASPQTSLSIGKITMGYLKRGGLANGEAFLRALSLKWLWISKFLDYLGFLVRKKGCMFFCATGETDNKVELCEHHMTCFKFRFRHLDLYIFCIFLNVVAIIYLPQSYRRRYNFFQK